MSNLKHSFSQSYLPFLGSLNMTLGSLWLLTRCHTEYFSNCKFDFQSHSGLRLCIVPVLQLLLQNLDTFGDLQECYLKYLSKSFGTNQLEWTPAGALGLGSGGPHRPRL